MAVFGFADALRARDLDIRRTPTEILQVNIGRLCNQACHHCHVEAGPKRPENMTEKTTLRLIDLLAASNTIHTGLSTVIGGTPIAKAMRAANAAGVHVAGTSAGAAFISEHMIAYGDEGASPVAGSVSLAPGLGLTNRFVIDQHFRQRDRLGRLLTALAYNPFAVGIGLDEDTAAFIAPDNTLQVEGSGAVTVVDAAGLDFSSIDTAEPGRAVCMLGLKLHILIQGATFNLHTRQAAADALARIKT